MDTNVPKEGEYNQFALFHFFFVEVVLRAGGKGMGFAGLQNLMRVKIRALTESEIRTLISELEDLKMICIDHLTLHGVNYEENSD